MAKTAPVRKLYLFKEMEDSIQKQRFDLVERLQKLEIMRSSYPDPNEYLAKVLEYIGYKRETYNEEPVKRGAKLDD